MAVPPGDGETEEDEGQEAKRRVPLLEQPLIVEGQRRRQPATTITRHNYALPAAEEVVFQSAGPTGLHPRLSTSDGSVRVTALPEPDPYGGRIRLGSRILEAAGVDLRGTLTREGERRAQRPEGRAAGERGGLPVRRAGLRTRCAALKARLHPVRKAARARPVRRAGQGGRQTP